MFVCLFVTGVRCGFGVMFEVAEGGRAGIVNVRTTSGLSSRAISATEAGLVAPNSSLTNIWSGYFRRFPVRATEVPWN